MEGFLSTGHGGFAVFFRDDEFNYRTLSYFIGNNGWPLIIAARQKAGKVGHNIPAFVLGRLMATLAVSLEDRPDLMEVTYLAGVLLFFILSHNAEEMASQNGR